MTTHFDFSNMLLYLHVRDFNTPAARVTFFEQLLFEAAIGALA